MNNFISIVISNFQRSHYLLRCLESIEQLADYPYEIIVIDDGSSEEIQKTLFDNRNRFSSLVLNTGRNMGLCTTANRGVELASSEYILFMNDDCWLVEPCFKDIIDVLKHPYIGWLCPGNKSGSLNTKFSLTNNLLGGYILAFRKEVWEEVKGWDTTYTSAQSDNVFLMKILSRGYWKAILKGGPKALLANFEEIDTYIATASLAKPNNAVPKIFNLPNIEDIYWLEQRKALDKDESTKDINAGFTNLQYWFDYIFEIFNTKFDDIELMSEVSYDINNINWTASLRHGQQKWRDIILNDFS